MLRLPRFGVATPRTVDEAVAALASEGARIVAGGTDLLVNLKHRLDSPSVLVMLDHIEGLDRVTVDREAGVLRIGPRVTLHDLSTHPDVIELAPSLADAAGLVANPTIRQMATIGGNIHLDTRCRYVNQSEFWRSAIGGCLKSEGDVCHVVKGGKSCVAAMSSDCVPVLLTLDARVVLAGPDGQRDVAMSDYYKTDGVAHIDKAADELVTEIRVPMATGPRKSAYIKWTVRRSIDFPLISVAVRFDLDSDGAIASSQICVGALAAQPRLVRNLGRITGLRLEDEATVEAIAALVHRQSRPLDNIPYDGAYRRKVLPVYVKRALAAVR